MSEEPGHVIDGVTFTRQSSEFRVGAHRMFPQEGKGAQRVVSHGKETLEWFKYIFVSKECK